MKYINNLYWPNSDQRSHQVRPNKMLADLEYVLNFSKQKRMCVQAGGAIGVWPQFLSKYFKQVYTFEANPHQFECLKANVTAENVYSYNYALGKNSGQLGFVHNKERCNASYVTRQGEDISCYYLDSFNFSGVDFICLDLEGYEFFALMGAETMLKEQGPVVQAENKRYDRYGVGYRQIRKFMESLGYTLVHTFKYDEVYVKI